jgi:zinc and cadmium transporter
MTISWMIAVASLAASLGVIAAAALVLAGGEAFCRRVTRPLISFAVGTLLGSAFLGLLPGALRGSNASSILAVTLAGFLMFFLLEKWLIWRHCHQPGCEVHSASGVLILVGDGFHNFVDGVVIAAAFLESAPLGISTTLAVIAHEVPQEVGDFGILLHSGYGRLRALLYNSLAATTTILGAALAYVAVAQVARIVPYVLAVSAASFLYIGAADLIPSLNRDSHPASGLRQFALVLAGVGVIAALRAANHF